MTINAEKATEIVKAYFESVKGASIKVSERPLIDWLDFNIISVKENEDYVVKCELKDNLFSKEKSKYNVRVSKEGEIKEVEREALNENQQQ